jgi:hypothetical protein
MVCLHITSSPQRQWEVRPLPWHEATPGRCQPTFEMARRIALPPETDAGMDRQSGAAIARSGTTLETDIWQWRFQIGAG